MKMTEINGKYFSPSLLMLSNNNCEETSYNASTITCHTLGMKKKLISFRELSVKVENTIIALKNNKTKRFTNTKLVIEKSNQNNFIENNKII